MSILVTGGTGYLGSHMVVELLKKNEEVVIADNLYNSKIEVLDSINKITGKKPKFYETDITDIKALEKVFQENDIDCIIHFAGLKAVNESVNNPTEYYRVNVGGTINIIDLMKKYNVKQFIFSSSATVYNSLNESPLSESKWLGASSPYGETKLTVENLLKAEKSINSIILRYFNPIGAHKSGLIGEDPNGIPNNLMPIINKTVSGENKILTVYGNDYNTKDGTCIRDYIHVLDLISGHYKSLLALRNGVKFDIYNLGTGNGYSVLDIINTFEEVNNVKINYKIGERREGDVAVTFANNQKALRELNWKCEYGLKEMCEDSWNFYKNIIKENKI